jgi:hypothetical protein
MRSKIKTGCQITLAMMVLGVFIFSAVAFADATIVDNLDMNGTANTSFGVYDNGTLVVGQEEQINGTLNRTRTITIDTSDDELRDYVQSNKDTWSYSGASVATIANIMGQSVDYLEGKPYNTEYASEIGNRLDSYFASDADVQQLLKLIDDLNKKAYNLNVRVAAIERTLEETASEDYCNAKLITAEKYNMTIAGLKCGLNSTFYYETPTGMMTIETYNPDVDSKPVKMVMAIPSVVVADTSFTVGIILNNTGTKFGAYKLALDIPSTWKAGEAELSGTIADQETKVIYIDITPDKNPGYVKTGAKIVLSGKTYKLLAVSNVTPIVVEKGAESPKVEEQPKIFVTADLLSNIGTGVGSIMSGTSDALKNISGNISLLIDNVTGNSSKPDAQQSLVEYDDLYNK